MPNVQLDTIELISTLRQVPANGSPSSQDYNDSQTESLTDLASLADFINTTIVPSFNALLAGATNGIEGRFVVSDTTDSTQLFFDSVNGSSLSVADSLRVLNGILTTTTTLTNNLQVQVIALQAALSSTNQNDVAIALQNFAQSLQQVIVTQAQQASQISNFTSSPYEVLCSLPGKPSVGQLVTIVTFSKAVTFSSNFLGSVGSCNANPTSTAAYNVLRNGASIGAVSISAGGTFTFGTTGGVPMSFNIGDRLTITAPSPVDTTLSDVGITLVGTTS